MTRLAIVGLAAVLAAATPYAAPQNTDANCTDVDGVVFGHSGPHPCRR